LHSIANPVEDRQAAFPQLQKTSQPTVPVPSHSSVFSFRIGILYAGGDVGPSITSLCLAFYWLYFLIEIAGIPTLQAGLIHGSGYVFSAFASLWAGHWLDRHVLSAAKRCRLIARLSFGLATSFALLWSVPPLGVWQPLWYLLLSWLFHLLFAVVYLAYLSLTALISSVEKERVELNSYRFGGSMLLTLLVLGLHNATEGLWPIEQRLLALGAMVALLSALGGALCGLGLQRVLGNAPVSAAKGEPIPWRALTRSGVLWWAVGGNLLVWFMVQSTLMLTIFLCAAAGISDALILLLLQVSIIAAAIFTSLAVRRWHSEQVLIAAVLLWCAGASLWWQALAPMAAAICLGLGLGAATVLSWARIPFALDRLAESNSNRVDARAYAGLTVLRDLVSALVPMLVAAVLDGHEMGGAKAGQVASGTLISAGLCSALLLLMLHWLCSPRFPAVNV